MPSPPASTHAAPNSPVAPAPAPAPSPPLGLVGTTPAAQLDRKASIELVEQVVAEKGGDEDGEPRIELTPEDVSGPRIALSTAMGTGI
jgi:hypothetical protein